MAKKQPKTEMKKSKWGYCGKVNEEKEQQQKKNRTNFEEKSYLEAYDIKFMFEFS